MRRTLETLAILTAGTWGFFALASIPGRGVDSPLVALALIARFAWWLLPVLGVLAAILRASGRLVSTRRDALQMAAIVAFLIWLGTFGELSLQTFLPAYLADPGFRSWYAGPAIVAAMIAVYAFPWLAWCVWPRADDAG